MTKDSQDKLDEILFEAVESAAVYNKNISADEADYIQQTAKQAIKAHIKQEFLALVGEMEARETEDMSLQSWSKEDYKAFGRNELRAELRKAIEKRYE